MSFMHAFQMALILAAILIFLFATAMAMPFIPTFIGTVSSFALTLSIR